jgi:hypothetical protein
MSSPLGSPERLAELEAEDDADAEELLIDALRERRARWRWLLLVPLLVLLGWWLTILTRR